MAVTSVDVDNVTEVLTRLLASDNTRRTWFRGQGCHRRELLPSLYRRMKGKSATEILAKEARLIARFRQRSLPWWPEGYPQSDWEQLFAMQHYGVPTRLLDWTENALSGLYFAADHERDRCECGQDDCWASLWVLEPARFNEHNSRLSGMPVDILTPRAYSSPSADHWAPGVSEALFAPSPVAIYGTHNSARIAAQQGAFTIAGKALDPLESSEAATSENVLVKYIIREDHKLLRDELRKLGISRAYVYPELPALAQDIAAEEGL